MRDRSWMERATCRGTTWPDAFFDSSGEPRAKEHVASLCSRCEVKGDCLSYSRPERYGRWGGGRSRSDRLPTEDELRQR
jgi:hypothetical protein